jgi:hypothetical protein
VLDAYIPNLTTEPEPNSKDVILVTNDGPSSSGDSTGKLVTNNGLFNSTVTTGNLVANNGPSNSGDSTGNLVVNDGNRSQPMDNTLSTPSLTLPLTRKQKKNK